MRAFEALQQEILAGELRPNQQLVEWEIAERLKMSRTPVREALGRLLERGYLKKLRNGSLTVHESTAAEIQNVIEIQEPLEATAIKLACQRATEGQIGKAKGCFESLARAIQEGEFKQIIESHAAFHSASYAGSQNERMCLMIENLGVFYYERQALRVMAIVENSFMVDVHREIMEALEKRDARAAEKAVYNHFKATRNMHEKIMGKI